MIPLFGPASLHHEPFWCVVVGRDGWLPHVDVVFIDHNYFETYPGSQVATSGD